MQFKMNVKFLFFECALITALHGQVTNFSSVIDILNILSHNPFESLPFLKKLNSDNDVVFYIYTRNNPSTRIQLIPSNYNRLNPSKPFKYIIHGWRENAEREWYRQMTDEYLKKGDYNVIQVDWSIPAMASYPTSVKNTKAVGAIIGEQISELSKKFGVPLANVHILGHSLGGHVAGFAGKEVIKQTGSKVARISGLDPAGPLFEGIVTSAYRLSSDDAHMVDVVHTDGGVFGFSSPLGTVDFFPNGGVPLQPGCNFAIPDFINLISGAQSNVFCSHIRSYQLFIESINSQSFVATKCESMERYIRGHCNSNHHMVFGENIPKSHNEGLYYFNTYSRSPFAQ